MAYGRYIAKDIPPEPPTPSLITGSIANILLLEPQRVDELIAIADCKTRGAAAFKAIKDGDRLAVTAQEYEEALGIAAAIRVPRTKAAEVAQALLMGPGHSEYAHRWDDASGLACKCMVDRLAPLPSGEPVLVELKTTTDPRDEPFAATVTRYGYDAQAAFNLRGIQHALGGYMPRFFWIAVRNEPPYEVYVSQLSAEFYASGEQQIERDIAGIVKCLRGDAPWCSGEETLRDGIKPLMPPAWRLRELYRDMRHTVDNF